MAKPATELEDLGPPDDDPAALSRRRAGQPSTARVRLGLSVGGVVFTIGALIQILAVAWFGLLMVLFGGSAEVLVHTGGLEPRTFATCSVAAIVLDAAMLLAIAMGSARRALREPSPRPAPFTTRHPFAAASGGLVLALAFVLLCGWRPSPYFPYPLATVIVLASAYWSGLVGAFVIVRLAVVVWRPLKAWASTTEWRAGFLTASLLLAGGGGYWQLTTQWYAAPLHAVQARLEIDDPDLDTGVLAGELDELCLAAGELARRRGIRVKLNTVVTALNHHEDMTALVRCIRPERWKIFQVLPVAGQNDGIGSLLVSPAQFRGYVERHAPLAADGIDVVPEDNAAMTGSYIMIDAMGRFFDNVEGRLVYGPPILDVGVEQAFASVRWERERMVARGGIYPWRRRT